MANQRQDDLQKNRSSQQSTSSTSQSQGRGVNQPNTTGAGETSTGDPSYGNSQDQAATGMKQNKQSRNIDK